jgi:hypothetical protein
MPDEICAASGNYSAGCGRRFRGVGSSGHDYGHPAGSLIPASRPARTECHRDPAGCTRSRRLSAAGAPRGRCRSPVTRRGYDWSGRYPAIAVTATLLRARSFTLDGEAVVCGPDCVAIFDALHCRGTVTEAMLYAFDLLALDGEDLRDPRLGDRNTRLARRLGAPARHRAQRPHRRRWRHALPASVPHGP